MAKQDICLFDYELSDNEYTEAETEDIPEAEELPDEELIAQLKNIIFHEYDSTLSDMPAKLSVTQITKKLNKTEEPFDFKLKRPRFKSSDSKLTGAERGTAIHTFLQYCDFACASADIAAEIENVAHKGYISKAEAESIDKENAAAFFKSELYARLCRASSCIREKKFMVAINELKIDENTKEKLKYSDGMIKGIIDLMFEEPDGIVIVDYKSDRGISLEKLKDRYSMQLRLYKAAIELTTRKKVKETILYSFELRKYISVEL